MGLYGPNRDAEAVRFYQDFHFTKFWVNEVLDSDSNVILGGDFNCPLDLTFDEKGGIFNSSTTCDKLDWKYWKWIQSPRYLACCYPTRTMVQSSFTGSQEPIQ